MTKADIHSNKFEHLKNSAKCAASNVTVAKMQVLSITRLTRLLFFLIERDQQLQITENQAGKRCGVRGGKRPYCSSTCGGPMWPLLPRDWQLNIVFFHVRPIITGIVGISKPASMCTMTSVTPSLPLSHPLPTPVCSLLGPAICLSDTSWHNKKAMHCTQR